MSSNRVPAQLSGDEAAAAEEIFEKLQSSESRSGFLFVNRMQQGAAFEAVLRRHELRETFGTFPSATEAASAVARALAIQRVSAEIAMASVEAEGLTLERAERAGSRLASGGTVDIRVGVRRMFNASGGQGHIGAFASAEEAARVPALQRREPAAERPARLPAANSRRQLASRNGSGAIAAISGGSRRRYPRTTTPIILRARHEPGGWLRRAGRPSTWEEGSEWSEKLPGWAPRGSRSPPTGSRSSRGRATYLTLELAARRPPRTAIRRRSSASASLCGGRARRRGSRATSPGRRGDREAHHGLPL